MKRLGRLLAAAVCAALLGNSLPHSGAEAACAITTEAAGEEAGLSGESAVAVDGGISGSYGALADALAAITAAQGDGGNNGAITDYTMRLFDDMALNQNFSVPQGAHITLDLNGHSIASVVPGDTTNGFSIAGKESALYITGRGSIDISSGCGFIIYFNNNELTIDIDGTISHSGSFANSSAVMNAGTFTLKNGRLSERDKYGIYNQGSVRIEGGSVAGPTGIAYAGKAFVTVAGGGVTGTAGAGIMKLNSSAVSNGAVIDISGGMVTGSTTAAAATADTWKISGGTFGNVVRIGGAANAKISGEVKRPVDYTGTMFLVEQEGAAVVTGIVDGGALWSGTADPVLGRGGANSGAAAGAGAASLEEGGFLFAVLDTGCLTLEEGAVLRNNDRRGSSNTSADASSDGKADRGGAVCLLGFGSMIMNEGAAIRDCSATTAKDTDAEIGGGADSTIGGGAAVCVCSDKAGFTMNGGTICGCFAEQSGGAVLVSGKFTMSGGSIANNQSMALGAGVTLAAGGELLLSGDLEISGNMHTGNTAGDVYNSGGAITVTDTLTGCVGISQGNGGDAFAEAASPEIAEASANAFMDNGGTCFAYADGARLIWSAEFVAQAGSKRYKSLQEAAADAVDGDTIFLLKDIAVDQTVSITKSFTLTSAEDESYTLSRKNAASDLLAVSGCATLILEDITLDGASESEVTGALVALSDGAKLYMKSGTKLCNNRNGASDSKTFRAGGGAVRVEDKASLFIEDGEISGCSAQRGAAVYVENGAVSMSGGYLTACSAAFGGGIYLSQGASMSMTGGRADACTADTAAGGVYVTANAVFLVSGEPVVKDNTLTAADGTETPVRNNIYLAEGAQITQTGDLTERAELYITHETEPAEGTVFGMDNGYSGSGRYFSDQDINFTAERNTADNSLIWTIQVPKPELPAAGRGRWPGLMGAASILFLLLWIRALRRLAGRKV